jgi:hypothetical protein
MNRYSLGTDKKIFEVLFKDIYKKGEADFDRSEVSSDAGFFSWVRWRDE